MAYMIGPCTPAIGKKLDAAFKAYGAKYSSSNVSMGAFAFDDVNYYTHATVGATFSVESLPPLKHTLLHLRVPYLKRPFVVSKENVQPFLFNDRYIAMHNGYIEYGSKSRHSDSHLFFTQWLSYHVQNNSKSIKDSFVPFVQNLVAKKDIAWINAIIIDRITGEAIAYHGEKDVPPMYINKRVISNFPLYKTAITIPGGHFWWRASYKDKGEIY